MKLDRLPLAWAARPATGLLGALILTALTGAACGAAWIGHPGDSWPHVAAGAVTAVAGAAVACAVLLAARLIALRDRVQERAAERALRVSEERLRATLDHTPAVAVQWCDGDGRVQYWNRASEELYGYGAAEALGRTLDRLILTREQAGEFQGLMREMARTGKPVGPAEITLRRKDGAAVDVLYTSFAIPEAAGGHTFVCMDVDITERKRAEQALRASEEEYRQLFESNPLPVFVRSEESLAILAVNQAMVEKYGYTRAEFARMTTLELQAPASRESYLASLSRREPGAVEQVRRHQVTRDGRELVVEVTSRPYTYQGRAVRLVVARDVTEALRTERALRESQEQYDALFAQSAVGVTVCDLALRYLQVNDKFCEMTGYSRDELTRMSVPDVNFPENVPDVLEHYQRLVAGDTRGTVRVKALRRKDASALWVSILVHGVRDTAAAVQRYIAVLQDVTEHKRAEAALAQERNMLRALIDNLPELVFVKDLEHRFVLANSAWIRVRMKGDAGVLGRRLKDVFPPAVAARGEDEDDEVFRSGRPSREREIELTSADGAKRCYVIRKMPLRDAAGGIAGLVGISRDVTEERQHVEELARFTAGLEARVRERTAQLERANRELEAFTFSVSHDLRAPLRAIEGFSERVLLEAAGRLGAKAEGYVQRVRLASQRMARLIDNLLELSKTGRRELHRRFVDVSAMAGEIGAELREAEPERAVRLTVQPGVAAVADGELLRIVLDNLLRNAWKFTSGRGEAEIEVGWERRDGRLAYFVKDNGAGFDMRRAGRLFTPFQRLHRAAEFPGTGIGLAVAQRVVRRHLGEIWAAAEVDQGASFFFTLDADNATAAAAAAGSHPHAPPEAQRRAAERAATGVPAAADDLPAVLVVDDDEAVVETLREELGRDGHLIYTAPDGAAGLKILEQSNVAVVVSDYSMPGMSGTEFLGAVSGRRPGVVRILYTRRPDARVLSETVNQGVVHCLVDKEWDRLYLRARVREAVIAAARHG